MKLLSRRTLIIGSVSALPLILGGYAAVQLWSSDNEALEINTDSSGVAIRGYDPVAYFTLSRPVPGSPEIIYRWADATWQFSSESHRDQFIAEPEKFAPRYGGHCAMGIADGFIANVDPEAWTIVDGRLYLNRSAELMKRWRRDPPGHIAQADVRWSGQRDQFKNVWTEGP